VPIACVGGARPCAGHGTARARSAVLTQQPHAKSERTRPDLPVGHPCTCGRWGAAAPAPALEVRRRYKQAGVLGLSVNALAIDTTFGCCPSSKAAGAVPKGGTMSVSTCATAWHMAPRWCT
jgi:hypothetical protein